MQYETALPMNHFICTFVSQPANTILWTLMMSYIILHLLLSSKYRGTKKAGLNLNDLNISSSSWFCTCAFFFLSLEFSRLSLQNVVYWFFAFTCAQRQRLRGSRKEKMYKDNTLGSLVVKSRASAGIFSWSFRQQNFCCDREQRSNRPVKILLRWESVHLSNWKKRKVKKKKKNPAGSACYQRFIRGRDKNSIELSLIFYF